MQVIVPKAPCQLSCSNQVELSDEQDGIVDAIVSRAYSLRRQTLGGYAGTGKTTCIRAIRSRLPSFKVCAFTGKAANMLRKKGIHDASTIHSLIYIPVDGPDGRTHFELRKTMPEEVTGFIVDEASMVSAAIYEDLMSFGLPCIFVGDHGQLEPVGSDFNLMQRPDYTLEKIHRNSGEVPRFAEWLRLGKQSEDFEPKTDAVVLHASDEVDDATALSADQIICAFNRTRVQFNEYVRSMLGRKELIEIGDRVMCLRNNRDLAIFNGMQGVVSKVVHINGNLHIDFDTYSGTRPNLIVDRDQFGREKAPDFNSPRTGHPFDYAYAITAHKAQGDEWPSVLVFEQKCKRWDHRRWAYTAASRAQTKLIWVTSGKGGSR
jgi:exodeoxyribonuclease V